MTKLVLTPWTHTHAFDQGNQAAERGTRAVLWITAIMMVIEIVAGWRYNSMALLADGWHMSSHVLAIGLTSYAYKAARHYTSDPRFAFGTWKIEVLAGFTSAIFLLGIAGIMVFSSVERVLSPQPIRYQEAIIVAIIGLLVNIVSAMILGKAHHHHDHATDHHTEHAHHHDLNLKSAYVHVITDAATSVLAIIALLGGLVYGWSWLDPVMGIVGAILVAFWAKNLISETGKVLLDREMDHPIVDEIRTALTTGPEAGNTHITDLHVWRVGKQTYSCALSVVTQDDALTPQRVQAILKQHAEIGHMTIEIHRYP